MTNENLNFTGLDDLLDETEGDWLAQAGWLFLRLFVVILSALTTFAFFANYVGGAFTFIAGDSLSPYISGIAGLLVLDVAALTWGYLRGRHADTAAQMAIAGTMGIVDLSISILVTAVFFALNAGFSVGIYDAAGNLTTLGQTLHYVGVVIIILAVSSNFAAGYLYAQAGASTRQAVQRSQLAAKARAGNFAADQARIDLVTRQTLDEIMASLPDLAQKQGQSAGRDYLARTMRAGNPERTTLSDRDLSRLYGVLLNLLDDVSEHNGHEPTADVFDVSDTYTRTIEE